MQDFRLHVCFTESYFVRKIVRKCFRKWFNRKDNTGRDFYGQNSVGAHQKLNICKQHRQNQNKSIVFDAVKRV